MRLPKISKTVISEILMLTPLCIILDIIIYLIYSFVFSFSASMAFSLIIGTAFTIFNLFLLAITIELALTKHESKAKMFTTIGYIIRYLLTGCVIYIAFRYKYLNAFGVILPMFYPKVIYVFKAYISQIFRKGEE